MNSEELRKDGFRELLMLQTFEQVPSHMEEHIMQQIVPKVQVIKPSISLHGIYYFTGLVCLYVLISLASHFYPLNLGYMKDAKLFILLAMLVLVIYGVNEKMNEALEKFILKL